MSPAETRVKLCFERFTVFPDDMGSIPNSLYRTMSRNPSDRLETGLLEYIFATARQMSCAPRVAMKG